MVYSYKITAVPIEDFIRKAILPKEFFLLNNYSDLDGGGGRYPRQSMYFLHFSSFVDDFWLVDKGRLIADICARPNGPVTVFIFRQTHH